MTISTAKFQEQVRELAEEIKPLLAGHEPVVQGAVLAELISLWLAGHHPDIREPLFDDFIEVVEKLIPVNEVLLFGPGGHPGADDSESMQ
jgi:hypothetical protein